MNSFNAFRIHEQRAGVEPVTLEQLSAGEVVIRVQWSGINYKDALAVTGKGRIVRRFPLVGGVDLAGVVESSSAAAKPAVPMVMASRAVNVAGSGTTASAGTRAYPA